MTPRQRAEDVVNTMNEYLDGGPVDRIGQYERFLAAVVALTTPSCNERDCDDAAGLECCEGCRLTFCPAHIAGRLCAHCGPGPDPTETPP